MVMWFSLAEVVGDWMDLYVPSSIRLTCGLLSLPAHIAS